MPTDTNTAIEPEVPEVADVIDTIEINGASFSVRETVKKKGKGSGKLIHLLEPENGDYDKFFAKLSTAVGKENWNKLVYAAVVRPMCSDATQQALNESKDNTVTESAFAKAVQDYAIPGSRRTGEHVKDLREKAMEVYSELNPLLLLHFKPTSADDYRPLTSDEQNRMLQLTLEYSDLQAKIEGKSRKGKTAAAKK